MAESALERLTKQYGALKRNQEQWLPDYRDLSDMYKVTINPWLSGGKQQRSGRRNRKVIDGTGLYARRVLQAGMMSGLSSPSRPWFKCVLPDPELMEYAPVSRWLAAVQTRTMDVYASAAVRGLGCIREHGVRH
jgi:hypothetical protein